MLGLAAVRVGGTGAVGVPDRGGEAKSLFIVPAGEYGGTLTDLAGEVLAVWVGAGDESFEGDDVVEGGFGVVLGEEDFALVMRVLPGG